MSFTTSIQFIPGIDEPTEPEIHITTSKNRTNGTAAFSFTNPKATKIDILSHHSNNEIKGMYLIDNEGVIVTRNINLSFEHGKPVQLTGLIIIKNEVAWDRFLRFLKRYGFEHNLKYLTFSPRYS